MILNLSMPVESDLWLHVFSLNTYVYSGTDLVLSLMTTILFFHPLCIRKYRRPELNAMVSASWNASVRRYALLSLVQLITTIGNDIMMVIRYLMWIHVIKISDNGFYMFNDIKIVIAAFDCLMTV